MLIVRKFLMYETALFDAVTNQTNIVLNDVVFYCDDLIKWWWGGATDFFKGWEDDRLKKFANFWYADNSRIFDAWSPSLWCWVISNKCSIEWCGFLLWWLHKMMVRRCCQHEHWGRVSCFCVVALSSVCDLAKSTTMAWKCIVSYHEVYSTIK